MTTATIVITDDDLMNLVAKLFIQKAKRVNIGNAINPKVNARPKDVADSLIDQTGALNCCTKELGSITFNDRKTHRTKASGYIWILARIVGSGVYSGDLPNPFLDMWI